MWCAVTPNAARGYGLTEQPSLSGGSRGEAGVLAAIHKHWSSLDAKLQEELTAQGLRVKPPQKEADDLQEACRQHLASLPESIQKLVQEPKQELTYGEAVSDLSKKFKLETSQLRDLVQQSITLQERIDKAKQSYEELLRSMQVLTEKLQTKQAEVEALQKQLQSKLSESDVPPAKPEEVQTFDAFFAALEKAGLQLDEAQRNKVKEHLVEPPLLGVQVKKRRLEEGTGEEPGESMQQGFSMPLRVDQLAILRALPEQRSVDGEWQMPRRFAKPREACFDCCTLSGPQFFNLAAADAEVEHVAVSGEAVAGDSEGDWTSEGDQQAPVGGFVTVTFGRGFSSPRGERFEPTRSGMPCEPGQFKGGQQGSQERVEDLSSHEAPKARDSVQHVEATVSQQQVQCEVFEQRGKHEPGAEEVLVAQQEEVVPLISPEVVIVEASPEDKPSGDSAQEQEASRLCEDISVLLLPLKPGVAVPAEVERKLVVLIERGTVEALQWKLIGAGYEAIGVQAQGLAYTLISLYLKDTEGPTGPRNAQILASLVAYVRELPEPWIIGRLITAGEITCTQGEGNELDFVLVSRCIEAAVTLTVDWQVPWKPHAALKLIVAGAGVADPRWRLPQFAKLSGDVSERDWPEVGAVTPHIMGQVGQDGVSSALARWAKAMEVCRGDPQGRGYQVDKVWGTVQETRFVQASTATAAGWWSRMRRCIITLQGQLSRNTWEQVQGNAEAADAFLQRAVG
ncbi:unnamed protein product, partial [Symbiodinium necroappetens]